MAPRKNVNKLVDGLVEARKTRVKKEVVPTVEQETVSPSIEPTRAEKEAALASILPDIEANAQELAKAEYVQHTMQRGNACQAVAGNVLDQEALEMGIVNSEIVEAGAITRAFKIEIADEMPNTLGKKSRKLKFDFWNDLIATKKDNPTKFVSIFIPNSVNEHGKKITMHSNVLYANRSLPQTSEYHFMCAEDTKAGGCKVWVKEGPYSPAKRATKKLNPEKPLDHLPKKTRELYDAIVAVKLDEYENAVNNAGKLDICCKVAIKDIKSIVVTRMSEEAKDKAIVDLRAAGVLNYISDDLMIVKCF
jgi:hypothetical protein